MPNQKRKLTKPRKRKGKVSVRQKVEIRSKGAKKRNMDNVDTMPNAPTIVPSNAPVFKVKIRKKR